MTYASFSNGVMTHAAHVNRFADFAHSSRVFRTSSESVDQWSGASRCGTSVSIILGSLGLAAGRVARRPDNPYDGNYSTVIVVVAAAAVCF